MLLIITKGGIYTYRAFLKSTKLFLINKVIIYDGYIVPINTDQIIKEDCEPAKICSDLMLISQRKPVRTTKIKMKSISYINNQN